jgi:hypothetical protein
VKVNRKAPVIRYQKLIRSGHDLLRKNQVWILQIESGDIPIVTLSPKINRGQKPSPTAATFLFVDWERAINGSLHICFGELSNQDANGRMFKCRSFSLSDQKDARRRERGASRSR